MTVSNALVMHNASNNKINASSFRRTTLSMAVFAAFALHTQAGLAQTNPANEDQTLPAVHVNAEVDTSGTTEGTGSYTTNSMSTATRLNLSVRETPQSISVVTRQQMDDLGLQSIEEITTLVPGLTLNRGATERASFYSRGFPISFFTEDGMPISSDGDTFGFATLAMYDRVEVLRGAAGMLTGAGNPSGTLNFVRKRPTSENQVTLTGSVGRWNNYRTELDASGALNEAKTFRARTVIALRDSDTYISNYRQERALIYATAEADLSRDTTLSFGFHYNDESNPGSTWYGLPTATNGSFLPFSRSTTNSPDWAYWDKTNIRVFAELEHRLANDWKLKFSAQATNDKLDSKVTQIARVGTTNTFRLSQANGFYYDRDQTNLNVQASGPFSLFGRQHEMVIGVNHRTRDTTDWGIQPLTPYSYTFDPANWNPSAAPDPTLTTKYYGNDQRTRQTGIYTTARFKVSDPLAVLVGARLDWYDHSVNGFSLTGTTSSGYNIKSEFTPYAAVVYDLNDTYSLYGSYTSIFNPQTATDKNGNLLDPVQGINMEAGIKAAYFGGKLNVSAAAFRIRQQNLATALTPAECAPRPSCSEAAGEVQSEGIELEMAGSLTPNWQMSGGITYNTAQYTKKTGANLPGTKYAVDRPTRLFRLATNYKLPGELNRWRIGGVIRAQNDIYKINNPVRQGGYTIVDLMAGFEYSKNLDFRLNFTNVFDKKYYQTIGTVESGNSFGEPRSVVLTARYKF